MFIDAVREVSREGTQSFLKLEHQERILAAYRAFRPDPGYVAVATTDEILANDGDLTVHHYVSRTRSASPEPARTLATTWDGFDTDGREFWLTMDELIESLDVKSSGR
jgi:type I restriction enzyme M protein